MKRPGRAGAGVVLFSAAVIAVTGCRTQHPQQSDLAFDAIVTVPAFRGEKPRMLFDDGHNNFHRSDGRYAPFVTLMRNDGFVVLSNTNPFGAASLAGHDVLVIVNAQGAADQASAFSEAEIDAVVSWVEGGGSLLLVADHSPFGRAADGLSSRFGVSMVDAYLKDEEQHDRSLPGQFNLLFTEDNGLIAEHPITRGRATEERVKRIVTFGGQALRVSEEAEPLLRLSPSAVIVRDLSKPLVVEPAGDAVQAVALRRGRGRVVVLGEAAALTAQIITGDPARALGVPELRVGMSHPGIDNKQFALNIARWLARSN